MRFEIKRHTTRNADVVEVFADDGRFIASLYPDEANSSLFLVSKYAVGFIESAGPPPGVIMIMDTEIEP